MKIYCRACGLECKPQCRLRLAESSEERAGGMLIREFLSDCCGYSMSDAPVTPVCEVCGLVTHVDDPPNTLQEIVGVMACAKCREIRSRNLLIMEEYRQKHKP